MTVRRTLRRFGAALILSTVALPAAAQTLGQGTDTDIPWLRLLAALAVCAALALAAAWALKVRMRQGGVSGPALRIPGAPWLDRLRRAALSAPRPDHRLRVVETLHLANHASVSLFRCDDRDFMLASTPQGGLVLVTLDDRLPAEDES